MDGHQARVGCLSWNDHVLSRLNLGSLGWIGKIVISTNTIKLFVVFFLQRLQIRSDPPARRQSGRTPHCYAPGSLPGNLWPHLVTRWQVSGQWWKRQPGEHLVSRTRRGCALLQRTSRSSQGKVSEMTPSLSWTLKMLKITFNLIKKKRQIFCSALKRSNSSDISDPLSDSVKSILGFKKNIWCCTFVKE